MMWNNTLKYVVFKGTQLYTGGTFQVTEIQVEMFTLQSM